MSQRDTEVSRAGNWWPQELGTPASSGSGENLRYAYFPLKCRLVVERAGKRVIYDTGDYQFRGAIQPNVRDSELSFASQRGRVNFDQLSLCPDEA